MSGKVNAPKPKRKKPEGGRRAGKARPEPRDEASPTTARSPGAPRDNPEPEEELEEPMDEGMLVDQGDGTRVLRRAARQSREDRESHECPDEPPKGWGEG